MNTPEQNVAAFGLELPIAPKPLGLYLPTLQVLQTLLDGRALLLISGHGPVLKDASFMKGKVGSEGMCTNIAREAARQTGLCVLASLRAHLGSLDRVKQIVKSLVMVNALPDFEEHVTVANGYADLMRDVFGDQAGVGTRSAIGMGSLPHNIPVEVELMVEIEKCIKVEEAAVASLSAEQKLVALCLELPMAAKPLGVYRPALEISQASTRGRTVLLISGHGPMLKDGSFIKGKVGSEGMSTAVAKDAARQTGLSILASLKAYLGSLDRVKQILKSLVMVNALSDFEEHVIVANGYADLMCDVFGKQAGVGSRSAVGTCSLPHNISVEVELMLEIEDTAIDGVESATLSTYEQNIASLCLELPPAAKPLGVYRPALQVSQISPSGRALLLVSGHGPLLKDGSFIKGKVGFDGMSTSDAKEAARQTGLSILATLRSHLGSLDRVKQIVKSLVMVNASSDFEEHVIVANGYADLMRDVFGEKVGIGSRSAVGVSSLPNNIPVEVELMIEIEVTEGARAAKIAKLG